MAFKKFKRPAEASAVLAELKVVNVKTLNHRLAAACAAGTLHKINPKSEAVTQTLTERLRQRGVSSVKVAG